MCKARAVNLRNEAYDVYIGRPRRGEAWGFGNPFVIGRDAARGEGVRMFAEWLSTGEDFGVADATAARRRWILDNVHRLRGRRLGCFCKPRACHGDVLADIANR